MKLVSAIVFILLSATVTHGQLGPRDNPNSSPYDINRVKVGDKAPDFTLEDMSKKKITLSDFRGKKNVVLIFYRGYW